MVIWKFRQINKLYTIFQQIIVLSVQNKCIIKYKICWHDPLLFKFSIYDSILEMSGFIRREAVYCPLLLSIKIK